MNSGYVWCNLLNPNKFADITNEFGYVYRSVDEAEALRAQDFKRFKDFRAFETVNLAFESQLSYKESQALTLLVDLL